jgi:hypothetical protein
VTLPVLIRERLPFWQWGPYLVGGPEIAYLLRARSSLTEHQAGVTTKVSEKITESCKRFSPGLYLGAGLSPITRGKWWFVELGLSQGLKRVGGSSGMAAEPNLGFDDAMTRTWLLSGGVRL